MSGIRVVELAADVAGAYCGKVLADLGADVLKVEAPEGDPLRDRRGAFLHVNTNKRSAVADPVDGVDVLWEVLASTDLVIESRHAGDLASWGISWDEVHAHLPRLVVTQLSGFGATGPYADHRWSDLVAQAFSGTLIRLDHWEREPLKLPGIAALCQVGHAAALAAVAAVLRADGCGDGAFVDCAASEVLAVAPAPAGHALGFEYRAGEARAATPMGGAETLLPSGLFPCADGYVALLTTPQQLPRMLDVLDDDALRAALAMPDAFRDPDTKAHLDGVVYPWLLERTRAELTATAQRKGWPVASVHLPHEVLAADHLHQRGFWVHTDDPVAGPIDLPGPPYRFAEGGWALRRLAPALGGSLADVAKVPGAGGWRPLDADTPPLDGVRVVDMSSVWAGPFVTLLLADLGAEVIRLENPSVFPPTIKGYEPRPRSVENLGALASTYGPLAEGRPDRPYNRAAMNNSVNRGKRSCTLDVRRPEGRALFMQLLGRSDVLVENFKGGSLARMGIHVSEVLERHPHLIVLRLPPAGLTGEWSSYVGFGLQFDGLIGLSALTGHYGSGLAESAPTVYMDGATGPAGAFAVVAALRYRERTGRGQLIELSQSENVLQHLGDTFVDVQLGDWRGRLGNRDAVAAPQGVYPCAGERRWLAITVGDDDAWAALTTLMGRPELGADPRLVTAAGRRAAHAELDAIVASWTSTQDLMEAFGALQAAGVAAAPVLDDHALRKRDPQLAAREWLRPLDQLDVGTHLHQSHAYRGLPQAWSRGAPVLGQDNEHVYRTILGLSEIEYEALRSAGIAVDDYLDPAGNPV